MALDCALEARRKRVWVEDVSAEFELLELILPEVSAETRAAIENEWSKRPWSPSAPESHRTPGVMIEVTDLGSDATGLRIASDRAAADG